MTDTAPVQAALHLIRNMRDLIKTAMEVHIYDADQGEKPEDDCGYLAAVTAADAYLTRFPAVDSFTPPTIGAAEIIRDLLGAVASLDHQVGQMRGMFPDDDGTIQSAVDDGDEATERARLYLKAAGPEPEPAQIVVTMDGGLIHQVSATRLIPGVEVIVIDHDTEGGDQDRLSQVQEGDGYRLAYVDRYGMGDPGFTAVVALPDIQAGAA